MKVFPKLGILCAFMSAAAMSALAVASAQFQPNMVATPFVADYGPHSKNFSSTVVSTGKKNPFCVSTNSSSVPPGSYSGIVVSSESNRTLRGIDTMSFSYKGPSSIETMVEYTTPGRQNQRAFARFVPENNAKGEFTKVTLNREQLGIPKDSSWNKIVLAQTSLGTKGRFLVDDIALNQNPVRKALNTVYFDIAAAQSSAPLGQLITRLFNGDSGPTSVIVKNGTSQPIQLYCQLQPIGGCSAPTVISAVYPTMPQVFPSNTTLGVITLQGFASLTTAYTGPLSCNYSVGGFNQLCPTNLFPNGIALAEVTLNNSCQGPNAQETADISLVNGLNARFQFDISGVPFQTVTNTGVTPPTITYVSQFENQTTFAQNFNRPGVFPYGCTNCTNNDGVSVCPSPGNPQPPSTSWNPSPPPYGPCNPSTFIGCNVSRNATSARGGTVTITYEGPASATSNVTNSFLNFLMHGNFGF